MYLTWLISLAESSIKWENLPTGMDERFLEWILLREGQAVLFKHPSLGEFSTKCIATAPFDVYGNPQRITSIGMNNGWKYDIPAVDACLVYDNMERLPIMPTLALYAKILADIDQTIRVNLFQIRSATIWTAPESKQIELANLLKQVAEGDPAVLGMPAMQEYFQVLTLSTGVAFMGVDLQTLKHSLMQEVQTYLGIDNANLDKRERLNTAEVFANNEAIEMRRLFRLTPRRQAADRYNRLFGTNILPVWNIDNLSHNYAVTTDIEKAANIGYVTTATEQMDEDEKANVQNGGV
jgi:hypothetical protein